MLPRAHGSGLFTRGQTQVMSVATLGTDSDEQSIDSIGLDEPKRYIHHYNFPPFSVGEARQLRGTSRRDIGHGALAERALVAVLPERAGIPVRDPRRVRHAQLQRLDVDGLHLRQHAWRCSTRACRSRRRLAAWRWAWSPRTARPRASTRS